MFGTTSLALKAPDTRFLALEGDRMEPAKPRGHFPFFIGVLHGNYFARMYEIPQGDSHAGIDALEKVETLVVKFNHKIYKEVLIDEESVDEIQKDATRYIIGIMKNSLSDNEATKIPNMLHSVNDLERVGDHCENIGHVALKKYEFNQKLTEEANNDLMECFAITKEFLTLTAKAIDEDDQDAARQTLELETKMNDFVTVAKQNHITRMKNDSCSIESGLIYNDIVIHNEKICDHLKNITQGIIHVGKR